MSDDERRYTLQQARHVLKVEECAASRHAPANEVATVGAGTTWYCECCGVAWVHAPKADVS